jgi:hypothetical protein
MDQAPPNILPATQPQAAQAAAIEDLLSRPSARLEVEPLWVHAIMSHPATGGR